MLDVFEYDGRYFDGQLHTYSHNAGYPLYANDPSWARRAAKWVANNNLVGKKVLEIGCAKGFFVEALCDLGVNAFGLDVSSYAIETCDLAGTAQAAKLRRPDLASKFMTADARTYLSTLADDFFDGIVSQNFLVCIPQADIPALVAQMNRVAKRQIHRINLYSDAQTGGGRYYTVMNRASWEGLAWDVNATVRFNNLVDEETI